MLDTALLPLADDRVRIRPLRSDDAAAYAEGTEDPAVRRFAHLPEPHYTPASVEAMISGPARAGLERGDLAILAIAEVTTDRFAGSLALFHVTDTGAEVGFWLLPASRGGGLAAATLELAARFARRSGLGSITARTVTGNHASQRVLVRAGFTETGREAGRAPSGTQVDLVHFARRLDGHPVPRSPG